MCKSRCTMYMNRRPQSSTPALHNRIPFVVGTAPVHTAENPARQTVPVLVKAGKSCTEIGLLRDGKPIRCANLCIRIFRFWLPACPFCNVCDTTKAKSAAAAKVMLFTNHKATLPF